MYYMPRRCRTPHNSDNDIKVKIDRQATIKLYNNIYIDRMEKSSSHAESNSGNLQWKSSRNGT